MSSHLNQISVCVYVHTYTTDKTIFEENNSVKLSREKFNIWKLRQKLFWKNQKRKKKLLCLENFSDKKLQKIRSALLQPFMSAAIADFLTKLPPSGM